MAAQPLETNQDFRNGVIDAFAEVVSAGVKSMALSHATNDYPTYLKDLEYARIAADKYHIHAYEETSLVETILFHNTGRYVVLLIKDPAIYDQYLQLKKEVDQSNAVNDHHHDEAYAYRYGRLLSYDDASIQEKIRLFKGGNQ